MSQLHAYCTYFDSGYLSRGLALIQSLRENGDDAPVWVLCLDDEAKAYLEAAEAPGVFILTMMDIEAAEPLLAPLRDSRSRMEYIFTSTPLLMRWVMKQQSSSDTVVIYLDSDLYFFDGPEVVLDALGAGSVGIIEHKYPARVASRLAKYGRFNVGWVGIRGDESGRKCVDWWAASTLAWCFDKPEDGKYADQGYLDQFPDRFTGVVVLPSRGFNLAPWNTAGDLLSLDDSRVLVDGDPLVFFHFHGLRAVGNWYVSSQLVYGAQMGRVLREKVYRPYVRVLDTFEHVVRGALGAPAAHKRGNGVRGLVSRARKSAIDRISILSGNAIAAARTGHGNGGSD